MNMGLIQKTVLALIPFEEALTCSILITGTQAMLRKEYFLRRRSWLRPKSWTYVQNFSSLGAIRAEN
jgi:hypothetical protein